VTHLGVDVAAFVDGQLSEQFMNAARAHLEGCQECRNAVRQQEELKSRMSAVSAPMLSPEFLASLAGLPRANISQESLWSRLRRSRPARLGVALLGASLTVAVVAYAIGGVRDQVGDSVTPSSDKYAADFFAVAAIQTKASLSPKAMNQLNESGWPCHDTLAGDLRRVDAEWRDNGQTIALTYANTAHKLDLFEQNGVLDAAGLHGFEQRTIDKAQVWIRDGVPTVITWDYDGVVYTVVTDAGRKHISRALAQLPTKAPDGGPVERIGNGLDRMTSWVSPAA